jgi:hypothetical protein
MQMAENEVKELVQVKKNYKSKHAYAGTVESFYTSKSPIGTL